MRIAEGTGAARARRSRVLTWGVPLLGLLMIARVIGFAASPPDLDAEGQTPPTQLAIQARALLSDSLRVLETSRVAARELLTVRRDAYSGTAEEAREALVRRVADVALDHELELLSVSALEERRTREKTEASEVGVQFEARGRLDAVSAWLLGCEGDVPRLRIRSLALHREGSSDAGVVRVSARLFAMRIMPTTSATVAP